MNQNVDRAERSLVTKMMESAVRYVVSGTTVTVRECLKQHTKVLDKYSSSTGSANTAIEELELSHIRIPN